MTLGHISKIIKSFMLVTLAMLIFFMFVSCTDDITAPRVDNPDNTDDNENQDGKSNISLNDIDREINFEISAVQSV